MRYLWLVIIALSLVPVAVVGLMLNPFVFWALGPEAWQDRLTRLNPYRWWLVFFLAVFGIATTVYTVRCG